MERDSSREPMSPSTTGRDAVLEKCAAALHVTPGDLGRNISLIVCAVNEPLSVGQVLAIPEGKRGVVVCPLTGEEFTECQLFNAETRQRFQCPDLRWVLQGERPDSARVKQHGIERPPECNHYYLCKEIA